MCPGGVAMKASASRLLAAPAATNPQRRVRRCEGCSEVSAMRQPKCEIRGQPPVIHETTVEAEGAVTRHLCQDRGQAASPVLDLGPQAAQAAEEQYRTLSDEEKEHSAR